jgi:hypothetical protein
VASAGEAHAPEHAHEHIHANAAIAVRTVLVSSTLAARARTFAAARRPSC